MIDKPFDQIDATDLARLVSGAVAEHRTLEFKRELGQGKGDRHRELLSDLTALANSQGGDMLIGIEQTKAGVAMAVPGIEIDNLDRKRQDFENVIRDRVEPRLSNYQLGFIPVGENRYVVHFRVRASLAAPHAVRSEAHRNYYMRNSAGKHEMDVGELRDAFTASEQLFPRLRRLHKQAVERSNGHDMPLSLERAPRCILSLIPRSYFREPRDLPITMENALVPFRAGYDFIPSLEGLIAHSRLMDGTGDQQFETVVRSYVLNHWDGRFDIAWTIGNVAPSAIERLGKNPSRWREPGRVVSPEHFEQGVFGMTRSGIAKLRQLGVEGPWTVFVTVDGIGGARLAVTDDGRSVPAWRDTAQLNGLTIEEATADALMPFAKSLWLLFGQHRPDDLRFGEV